MLPILYRHDGPHPSCFEILVRHLGPAGACPAAITSTVTAFMNGQVRAGGSPDVLPPRSITGALLALIAEMAPVLGHTACSAELPSNGRFKRLDVDGTPWRPAGSASRGTSAGSRLTSAAARNGSGCAGCGHVAVGPSPPSPVRLAPL